MKHKWNWMLYRAGVKLRLFLTTSKLTASEWALIPESLLRHYKTGILTNREIAAIIRAKQKLVNVDS